MSKLFSSLRSLALLLLAASLVLTGCAGIPAAAAAPQTAEGASSFTLKTSMGDGKMIFVGVGGDIDGIENPDLKVQPGDVVEITLIDGDGALHDISFPDFDATSDQIVGKDTQVTLTFEADQEGSFAYFCTVTGHRQAGMEGKLIVGSGQSDPTIDNAPSIVRDPADLPGPLGEREPEHLRLDLETVEVEGKLADGSVYTFWTFNGLVPGPFVRVRVGDTVDVSLKNAAGSHMPHSVDFHAVTGPGGGAAVTQTKPGEETTFTFKAINPGLYVYHCATPSVAHHITNGMYGLILVEPEDGLLPVDREFYVMQGELYTMDDFGAPGRQEFSPEKLADEQPEYYVFNGAVGGLTAEHPLQANTGETVRIFFGVGGPNKVSSFHVIGEIFDRVYDQASLTSTPLTDVQTTLVPAGGATVVEFKLEVPGRYILVDHSLSRLERGLAGYLLVEGEANPSVFDGEVMPGSGH
jgi:nitrite reductase (NO-forming)